jgi:hypothetical protein
MINPDPIELEQAVDFLDTFLNGTEGISPNKVLIKYARQPVEQVRTAWGMMPVTNGRGAPFGAVVAMKNEGDVYVGWSRTSRKDRYNKAIGLYKAIHRAKKVSELNLNEVHPELREWVDRMVGRASRYFHTETPNAEE